MLKLTSGSLKGRALTWKPSSSVRPTPAKVREAIFNILGDIQDTIWADLCAGSGIMGFEALSRGAKQVYFVERHRQTLSQLRRNAEQFQMAAASVCLALPVAAFFNQGKAPAFDIIYADPPYDSQVYEEILTAINAHPECLQPTGILILEHRKRRELPEQCHSLQRTQQRLYGDTALSFYQWNSHEAS